MENEELPMPLQSSSNIRKKMLLETCTLSNYNDIFFLMLLGNVDDINNATRDSPLPFLSS